MLRRYGPFEITPTVAKQICRYLPSAKEDPASAAVARSVELAKCAAEAEITRYRDQQHQVDIQIRKIEEKIVGCRRVESSRM
ncbi:MAG: hypothetical protein P8Y71_10045 [Pseudolabrys sp.]